ncbi:restriction endonuclease subunit S [Hydrogenophaga borbori]|uniref:restriction endonuclease subunit S n=1 Tax=Hydrogenophaga borbori TaxID=2294117 RepID=UPI00301D99D2
MIARNCNSWNDWESASTFSKKNVGAAKMFPDAWRKTTLGAIGQIRSGSTPDRSKQKAYFDGGRWPWVKTMDLTNSVVRRTDERITDQALAETSCRLFPESSVLVAMYGGLKQIGRTGLLQEASAVNQAISAIVLNQKVASPLFVLHWLNGNVDLWRSFAASSRKDPNITRDDVVNFPIALPSMNEQLRIVDVLETWDAAINTAEALVATSRRQKQDLMQGLMSGHRTFGVDVADWAYLDFNEIFERVTRKNTGGDQNVLTISGQHGLISQREYFSRVVASDDLSSYTHLSTGDFAYNKSSSNGYPMGAIKPLVAYDSGVVSSLYICFRIRPGVEADEDFFSHYFDAGMLNDEISGIAQEGARNHGLLNVSVKEFFKLKLRVPPLEDQRRIAEVLNTAQEEVRNIEGQLERLKTEKRALMADLLTGKRRIPIPANSEEAQETL